MKNFKVNIYVTTTWKSPKQKKGAAAWLVEFVKRDGSIETRPEKGPGVIVIEGTETEATLSALIEAVKILTKSCEIRIFTLNERILAPLKNGWLKGWKDNSFQNSKGDKVKNFEKWKEISELFEKHTCKLEKGLGEYTYILERELAKNVDFTLNEKELKE